MDQSHHSRDEDLPVRQRDVDSAATLGLRRSVDLSEQLNVEELEGTIGKEDIRSEGLKAIASINSELDHRGRTFKPGVCPPLLFSPHHSFCDSPDDGCLESSSINNERFLHHVGWLGQTRRALEAIDDVGDADLRGRRRHLLARIDHKIEALRKEKDNQWRIHRLLTISNAQTVGALGATAQTIDIDHLLNKNSYLRDPIYMIVTFLVITLHVLAGVSRAECRFIFIALRVTVFAAFQLCGPRTTATQRTVLNQIPKDIRTALKSYNLNPDIRRYACCPTCFATYAPDSNLRSLYPPFCTFQETANQPLCGAKLLRPAEHAGATGSQESLIRVFGYQPMSSWLARLFSRPELESHMTKAWESTSIDDVQHDIWDASALHDLRGPDNKPFSYQPPGSVHLVFSLFVDWFNPYSNKQAGKSHSTGAIYMVCLNLPRNLRYKLENVYLVGVIPGPREPSLSQINHFLRPLIDDLLILWKSGVRLRSTRQSPAGCLVRCTLGPLVCDIPALWKTAGFAGHRSKFFCSFCTLNLASITNLEKASWPRRTWAEHVALAECWRDAASLEEHQEIFNLTGIHWSELLRLPYWNPTRFSVLDAMHNLFLGELQHHCREVWGISVKAPNTTSKTHPHSPERQAEELEKAEKAIRRMSSTKLSGIRKGYISAIARFNNVVPPTSISKRDYISTLIEWFRRDTQVTIRLLPVLDRPTMDFVPDDDPSDLSAFTVLSADILQIIRDDISRTTFPSWLSRPPRNFGSASHGKLTADQWRSVCTINLIITLVREWSSSSALPRDKLLLANFVDLVIAVDSATRRSMSPSRIASYSFHMKRYLQSLGVLFERHSLVPNHHLSLHLDECLALFGPVHGWWSFPFERYNDVMQKLNTNNRPGDFEITFLDHFSLGSNLCAVASELQWPPLEEYQQMMEEFHETFSIPARGSLLENIIPSTKRSANLDVSKLAPLEEEEYQQLLARINDDILEPTASYVHWTAIDSPLILLNQNVQFVRSIKLAEAEYASPGRNSGNSFVLVKPVDSSGSGRSVGIPAQIQRVFLHSRRLRDGTDLVEPFFVVRDYCPLSDEDQTKDPYLGFPLLETRLCYNILNPHSRILKQADILCHFASYVYEADILDGNGKKKSCIVVRSLDRS